MVFKYHFSVFGDNFYPRTILDQVQGNLILESSIHPTDKKWKNGNEEYGYGIMSFDHPKRFSTEDRIVDYEQAFIEFIDRNYSLFIDHGVDDLRIFMEVFFDGGQCNFEIFNRDILKKISGFNIALPISVYVLPCEKIEKWENEIRTEWGDDVTMKE